MADRVRGFAHRVDIAGGVPALWRAFTEDAHLVKWCAPDAQMKARQGGLFRASVDRVTQMEAHIDVFVPERRVRLIYLPSPDLPTTDSAVVVDFIMESASPSGAIVRVLGSGIPDGVGWETQYKRMRMGWERAMARLKVYVEKQMDGKSA
ncbi:MAG: SRPBCC domain-containing protein [Gammaproteobacteria bacterium]